MRSAETLPMVMRSLQASLKQQRMCCAVLLMSTGQSLRHFLTTWYTGPSRLNASIIHALCCITTFNPSADFQKKGLAAPPLPAKIFLHILMVHQLCCIVKVVVVVVMMMIMMNCCKMRWQWQRLIIDRLANFLNSSFQRRREAWQKERLLTIKEEYKGGRASNNIRETNAAMWLKKDEVIQIWRFGGSRI